ncbi:CU044_5270 family protein [Streptomyces europaeiscabiei]|uniref:CU044_5270 family protein n=1 Tax=Streptomyces europaeiscabiei TaxID=146819 RepID=UPI000E693490|nr:CU044_5270 family protein [Streptomyces europaeiscabiei]MDX2525868.1 CU044_5270 family protein [Streptomyces europaeiscabiei]MDX3708411.1 CU044_5270 family protein [Streptomyces europaeiscabiei]
MNEEPARLLPPPPERDVPPDRLAHHKDRLMQLIDDDRAMGSTASTAARRNRRNRRSPSRLPRPALWLPAAALTLAGALAIGLVTTADSGYGLRQSDGESAVVLLDRIADVAARTEVEPVRDDQLVYVRSLTAGVEAVEDGPFEPGKLHQREVWVSQEPGPVEELALHYEDGDYFPLRELLPPGSPGVPAGIDRPTYTWLASLPTDPDELLAELSRLTRTWKGQEKAQAVFDKIGELLGETVMPPKTAAALYEAAAKLPGVTRTEDAVDPAGRHGVGIRRVDERAAWATEWVFDRDTLTYLGERSHLTADGAMGAKGTIVHETAVLKRAVVDKYRERPTS